MKMNAKDSDSLYDKIFGNYAFISEKQKHFVFHIFTTFQKHWWGFGILYLQGLQFYVTCSLVGNVDSQDRLEFRKKNSKKKEK